LLKIKLESVEIHNMEILIYAKAGCRDDERGGIDLVELFKGFGLNVASDCKLAYIGMYLPSTGSKISHTFAMAPNLRIFMPSFLILRRILSTAV